MALPLKSILLYFSVLGLCTAIPHRSNISCDSKECGYVVDTLRKSINFDGDPCNDFYDFACGSWVKNYPLPASASSWSQYDIVEDQLSTRIQDILESPISSLDGSYLNKVKVFYDSCVNTHKMDARGLKPLLNLLDGFGGWPLIKGKAWRKSKFNLEQVLADSTIQFNLPVLFRVSLEPDLYDSDRATIAIDQPDFFLTKVYIIKPEFKSHVDSYRQYVKNVAEELARNSGKKLNETLLNAQIEDFINFEKRLADVSANNEDRLNVTSLFNPYNVSDFQDFFDEGTKHTTIKWSQVLNSVFRYINVTIQDTDQVDIKEIAYIKSLATILEETPTETVANYVLWRIITVFARETTDKMREIAFSYAKDSQGLVEPKPRTEICSNVDLDQDYYSLGYAVSAKYLEKYFFPEDKKTINEMVRYLRKAFDQLLEESEWMDKETKEIASKKLKHMSQFIGYPDWLTNSTALESYYKNLTIKPGFHFENRMAILKWKTVKEFERYGEAIERNEMDSHAVYVNAYYEAERNAITFPAGILAKPFYVHKGPVAYNFGNIGSIIGHEITHGFDDCGSQFDDKGNAVDWWSPEMKERFNQRAECMRQQYGAFKTEQGSLNGNTTLGENIADNGGLRQAFRAYREWVRDKQDGIPQPRLRGLEQFSQDQLFFLSYANSWCTSWTPKELETYLLSNEHSPGRFRVQGSLSNSPTFAQAFNCPAGSRMNPTHKCTLW